MPPAADPVVATVQAAGAAASQSRILDFAAQVSPAVTWGVLVLLAAASLACWAVIFLKIWQIFHSVRRDRGFLKLFWDGRTLGGIYEQSGKFKGSLLAEVFRAGYRELKQLSSLGGTPSREGLVDAVQSVGLATVERALDAEANLQVHRLERGLGILATTASAGPFIGLFGTVWGIMKAFHDLGVAGASTPTIQAVAPGIAEALIATAIGLLAAIPAVLAYNGFANRIRQLSGQVVGFRTEFLNLAQRQVLKNAVAASGSAGR